ncbi:MAG: type I restriction endonuclease subunit R [Candidatus Melainabacteria bacterium]|nr:MAG: type I restriction endonuclease subunit R [Candidatus Melainabacteria bacterium]
MSENQKPSRYEPIALSSESTVVAEFVRENKVREESYQTEAELESNFLKRLQIQAYDYLRIKSEADLIANLRRQLEALNKIEFSESEWQRFFSEKIAGANDGIVEKTTRIQEDHIQLLKRDDGTTKNIYLIDKQSIHNNRLQVINQYEVEGMRSNRYDVTILVNGLPMIHVELKRRGVEIREAFNQINRYQRDSFWAGSGLFEYVQLFVISNGTLTKYYSNTVREGHLAEQRNKRNRKKTSNSFSFTSWWADAKNKPITELTDFTKTFFAKHTLLNILTKYCVFDVDRKLLVMRPYQIVAAESILQRIVTATNHRQLGTISAGGYIWHTTGSGKTLTSFKAAQLARALAEIDKVLFVVDRKDLDYQTMREYERFQKGAANSNTSTAVLQQQLEDPASRIIITTIQKLSRFVAKNKKHSVYNSHVVVIFDECHRSQFGDMHTEITKVFNRYHLFGFTGTPIFAANAGSGGNPQRRTTEQAFGDKLHTYTIVDAINDKNVLPFRIDYINTIRTAANVRDKKVSAIDKERALLAKKRITQIVGYIREHFDQKTKRGGNTVYQHGIVTNVEEVIASRNKIEEIRRSQRVSGFNSIFATASIDAAKRYYAEFTSQQQDIPIAQKLKIGLIYSFAVNDDDEDGLLGEEEFETEGLDQSSRDFLEAAIKDYNALFATSYDTSADKFQNYYKDLSQRLKNRELDVVIVVNMFLTGFDATTLNTLWVDKNLRAHGLIQAYSRTNRILNSVKTYGNIVSFRNLEEETNDALALFGNKDAKGIVLLKPYRDYYSEYQKKIAELVSNFELGMPIIGENLQKQFIKLFGSILRLKNILRSFDDFAGNEILSERDFQDYQSVYLNLYAEFRSASTAEKESINDDVVFEIELIKQVEINVDYILMLVERYIKSKGTGEDKEILATIERAISSSPSLRNKKDLIEEFVDSLTTAAKVDADWLTFIKVKKAEELDCIIIDESLNAEETRSFVENAFRDGAIPTSGTAITKIMPPVSRFSKDSGHSTKKQTVLDKLSRFFERYFGLS